METGCIVNENILRNIIKKIVEQETNRIVPKTEVDNLWKYMYGLHEEISVVQEQLKKLELHLRLK
jgi:hypothetical protein